MNPKPIELLPAAIADAHAARLWYAERDAGVVDAFMAELDQAIDKVANNPDRWPGYLHGTQRYLLRRFPFSVVYRERKDVIEVIAIAHAHKRPGYWRSR